MAFSVIDGKHSMLEAVGMNKQLVASGFQEGVEGGIGGAINAGNAFWNEEYTGFQHSAVGVHSLLSGSSNIAMGIGFGLASHSFMNSISRAGAGAIEDVYKMGNSVYKAGKSGVYAEEIGGAGMKLFGKESIKTLEKGATPGYWSVGNGTAKAASFVEKGNPFARFVFGWKGGLATAVLMASTWAAGKMLGVAGQLLDESHLAYNQSRIHTYDNRQFTNRGMQMWGMQNQQASMQAALPFEQNMLSIARVYHQR